MNNAKIPRLKTSLLVGLSLGLQLCIFIPGLIYATNQGEFSVGIINILRHLTEFVLVGLFLLVILGVFLPDRFSNFILSLVLGISLSIYVQSNILLWDYGIFDGKDIHWGDFFGRGILDAFVWILIVGSSIIFSKRTLKSSSKILIGLSILHIMNLCYVINGVSFRWMTQDPKLENATLYSFSPEKNVVMIVLDGFLSPAFNKILELDEDTKRSFNDFVYFKNTLASFPTTSPSIPAMLSGAEYDNTSSLSSFLETTFREHSIPSLLFKNGFQVDLVTLDHYCKHIDSNSCSSLASNGAKSTKQLERRELAVLFDMTLFRSLPSYLKRFVYNDQGWLFQGFFQNRKGPSIHVHSLNFVDSFIPNSKIDSKIPTFKFIHLIIPHIPLRLGPNCEYRKGSKHANREEFLLQAKCALKLTNSLIERLKELNVYDQSMVVVLADHGLQFNLGDYNRKKGIPPLGVALPLLLVKPFHHHGTLETLNVPAKLSDVPETIRAALSVPGSFPGQSVFDISPSLPRKRIFRNYQWQHSLWKTDGLPKMKEFLVDGDAWNPDSWTFAREIAAFDPNLKIE